MTYTTLIWKTRIGTLKPLAVFTLVVTGLFTLTNLTNLVVALQNQGEPRETTISQMVNGEVSSNKYIMIHGVVRNDENISPKETPPASYFFVRDEGSSNLILVRWDGEVKPNEGETLIVNGITYRSPPDLYKLISNSLPSLESEGLETTPGLYLNAGETPPDIATAGFSTLFLAGLCFLSGLFISFPAMVFQPCPLDGNDESGAGGNKTRATGKLHKLIKATPPYEFDGDKQKTFENADASFERVNNKFVLKFHQYSRRKLFGYITMKVLETDWAVILHPGNLNKIETGVLYTWRISPALRLRYHDPNNNSQMLLLDFKNYATLEACLKAIKG